MGGKKKGKSSKLNRMSDEEKLRYLQHRAELELEAKRRKEQLIAIFTKNKLKREEIFSRINTAKINEQWRNQLRKIKCKELYDKLEYNWKYFDKTLNNKNNTIFNLYNALKKSDNDHRVSQTSHIEIIDNFIKNYIIRLNHFKTNYMQQVLKIKINELNQIDVAINHMSDDCKHLKTILYSDDLFNQGKLHGTNVRNAIHIHTILNLKREDHWKIDNKFYGLINNLWEELNGMINNYNAKTKDRMKEYKMLKENDDRHLDEFQKFPGIESNLLTRIDKLKHQRDELNSEQSKRLNYLKKQLVSFESRIMKMKNDIKTNNMKDEIKLKKLSVASNTVIKYLSYLKDKSVNLMVLLNICCNLESEMSINKFNLYFDDDLSLEKDDKVDQSANPYDKLDKFWEKFNYLKLENINNRKKEEELSIENDKLKSSIRFYFKSISNIPISNFKKWI